MALTPLAAAALALILLNGGVLRAQDAPAPEAAPTVVLFGFAREAFDAAGLEAIAATARAALREGSGAVLVEGHTDTSGDAGVNRALSARRAQAVREDLVARGVPLAATATEAFGETRLAVATPDGVAEPANRRAVITRAAPGAHAAPDPDTPIRFPLP